MPLDRLWRNDLKAISVARSLEVDLEALNLLLSRGEGAVDLSFSQLVVGVPN